MTAVMRPTLQFVWLLALAAAGVVHAQGSSPAATVQPVRPEGESIRALVVPLAETTLASPVAGRIKSITGVLGAGFEAGDVLVELDCREPDARLGIAKAELAGAVEEHEAKLRMQGLQQASDLEVALAASSVAKAKSQVVLQGLQVSQCQVKAPWAGRIAKAHVRNFMSIAPGQPLLDLVRAGAPRLKLNVPSRWISQLHKDTLFEVRIEETGRTYAAQIRSINSRVDAVSQTVEIEATLVQARVDLLPGMSGIADFSRVVRR